MSNLAEEILAGTSLSSPKQVPRKIIHVDMDCFFAAIEMRDNPELRNVPLAIGSQPNKRGVLCTSNYIARKYGVRSAMSSSQAVKLCPKLLILPPNSIKIREASQKVRKIFSEYSDKVQPLSCDEAFLDVTDSKHCQGSATLIAEEIRQRIFDETGLTASAGIAPNKFLAKVASDWKKPNGQYTIIPSKVLEFVKDLPVEKIPGVGKVTKLKLHQSGFYKCGDLHKLSLPDLKYEFGKLGEHLNHIRFGIDNRPVKSERLRKSLSLEETYARDIPSFEKVLDEWPLLVEELIYRLEQYKERKNPKLSIVKIFVKIKFHDFQQVTVEKILEKDVETIQKDWITALWGESPIPEDLEVFIKSLLETAWKRGEKPVRLLGIGVRFFDDSNVDKKQLRLL